MNWFTGWLGGPSKADRPGRNSSRLQLETMEERCVPATLHSPSLHDSTSSNWSGYAVSSNSGSVTAVSGSFTVPTVSGSGTAYASTWVGIDGYNSRSVEQTGIEEDVVNGVAQYSAWYEMYPAYPVTVNLAIHAGDQINASVSYANGRFTLTLTDLNDPAGQNTFSVTKSGSNLQRSSAEWIQEAPSSNAGVLPLANFGTVTFTNAQATINGTTGAINNSAWSSEVQKINMVNSGGTTVQAATSPLSADGTSFAVAFGSLAPAAPGNSTPPVTPPPTSPPPTTSTFATTTTLTGTVNPNSYWPSVTLTATVSPSVPVGSKVELLYQGRVLATGSVQMVNGVEEVSFDVVFYARGTYTFTAEFMGSGSALPSTSNAVTVTVS
jgi:hypothetical protein